MKSSIPEGLVSERRRGALNLWTPRLKFLTPLPECFAVLAFIAVIWLSIWVSLSGEYNSAKREALHDTMTLAHTFEDNAQRIVASIDQTLLSLRVAYAANPDGFDSTVWNKQQNRPDHLTVQIGLIGPTGIAVSSTMQSSPLSIDVSDREHFKVQLDPTHDDLFISKPVLGRGSQRQTVQFTRKLLRRDGSFGGVVVLSLGCDELSKFYQASETGGFVLLAGFDGIVRARGPLDDTQIGVDLHERPYFVEALRSHYGALETYAGARASFMSFRHLDNYPLMVIVGLNKDRVFADYRASCARWIGIGLMVTIAVGLLGGCWIVQRRRLISSKRALRTTLDSMSQGIAMVDARGRVPVMNQRAAELLDMSLARPGIRDAQLALELCSIGAAGPGASGILQRGSKLIEVHNHTTPFGDSVLTYTDVTERHRDEARILHLALHDGLTGLANRVVFGESIAQATAEASSSGMHFALLALDLDGFKAVNDGLGHDIGDLVLVEVAERLAGAVRVNDTVARMGGDEFTILVRNIASSEIAEQIAEELVRVLANPMHIAGHTCAIGTSIGIAVFPLDGSSEKELLKNADVALYSAKSEGGGRYRRFESGMCSALQERRWLERELRVCMECNQLEVHFQPQLSSDTMMIVGFEALARWNHPERGFIPPSTFISIAEESGLVIAIGRAVLEQACAHAATWHPRCRVAVNISPVQFQGPESADPRGRDLGQDGASCRATRT